MNQKKSSGESCQISSVYWCFKINRWGNIWQGCVQSYLGEEGEQGACWDVGCQNVNGRHLLLWFKHFLICGFFCSLGSYVARDASCSHQYCPSSTGYHSMFVTLAVVGDFVHGIKAYLCPPSRPEISNRLSDSCVDDQKILQFLSSLRRTRFILPISWSILVGCCQR